MKKPYMRTIIGFSVLIILFQFYGSKVGSFKSNLLWIGQYDSPSPQTSYWEKKKKKKKKKN